MGKKQNSLDVFRYRTLEDYLLIQDNDLRACIDEALRYVEPKNKISLTYKNKEYIIQPKVKDLFEIEYKWVLYLREKLESKQQNFMLMYKILEPIFLLRTQKQFRNCSIFDLFAAYSWVLLNLKNIGDWELTNLHTKPTQKEKNAGIERFNELGYVPTLDGLAKGYLPDYDTILEMKTGLVLRKLRLSKLTREYYDALYKEK